MNYNYSENEIQKAMRELMITNTQKRIDPDEVTRELLEVQPMNDAQKAYSELYEETKKGDVVLTFKLNDNGHNKECNCLINNQC